MKNTKKSKNVILAALAVVIAAALGIGICGVLTRRPEETVNTNVTLVSAPEQTDFEVHPEWALPEAEPVDYGENIALGKTVTENGHTQVYHCRNINDGETLSYWEGRADDYPNEITFDLISEEAIAENEAMDSSDTAENDAEVQNPETDGAEVSGARILLNPRSNWGARTQEVEVQASDDNETFTTIYPRTTLSFDPNSGNFAYMEFDAPVRTRYLRFVFYANSGATAGQAAEIEIYAPGK